MQKHYRKTSPHHQPQLFTGVPERIGCIKKMNLEIKRRASEFKEERKELKQMIWLPYPMRQACMNK